MDSKTRLQSAITLQQPDRTPILGGWLAAPGYIQHLTGCSEYEYWFDPLHWSIEAEHILGSDGLVDIFKPIHRGEYRCVDGQVLEKRDSFDLDDVIAWIDSLPDALDLRENYALATTSIHPDSMALLASVSKDFETAYQN
ncbi:MAG: hypothetical protein K8I30_03935, partial [Anaerolineae bacterium]|nr:hypothetical protein [Anaerolineae bacterium]